MDSTSQRQRWKRLRERKQKPAQDVPATDITAIGEGKAPRGWPGGQVVDKNLTGQRLPFANAAAPLLAQKAANKTDLIRHERSTELMETSLPEPHTNGVKNNGGGEGVGSPPEN